MNKDIEDMLFDTLDALTKHTSRINALDKKSNSQVKQLETVVSTLEKQIEVSSKDILLQLIESGNTDKEKLVKDITNAIATNIAKLSINGGAVTVNVETDAIAHVIGKLPINNTNNIVIDTEPLAKENKQFLKSFQTMNINLNDSLTAMKLLFQELSKREQPVIAEPIASEPSITGMSVNRDKDGMISSVAFIRG